ncbi:phage tail sheath C-terminal domain-containing protein [Agarilytica rhodophyticola]|uniref:phage tail sheath C-terminal domain-containing protein n=1 Tax=Agarilytica rhodophyticola TaxID=1737490 RepID=UPI000B3455AB|nr:phage tail sheath C-terminal domain-containing protein [Agarilytica rhodophyticola]
MFAHNTPGVYFHGHDSSEAAIPLRRMDIAGFVGIAAKGPLHKALRVDSWTQFTSTFGEHIPQAYLAYAVEGFFSNGGRTCWIVRVAASEFAKCAEVIINDDSGQPALALRARSPGIWANQLRLRLLRNNAEQFSIVARDNLGGQEIWRNLDLQPQVEAVINNDPESPIRIEVIPEHSTGDITALRVPKSGRYRVAAGETITLADSTDASNDALKLISRHDEELNAVVEGDGRGLFKLIISSVDSNVKVQKTWFGLQLASRAEQVINTAGAGSDWFYARLIRAENHVTTTGLSARNLRTGSYHLSGGSDGLQELTLAHVIGTSGAAHSSEASPLGLDCLASVDAVNLVAIPDLMPVPQLTPAFKPDTPNCSILEPEFLPELPTAEVGLEFPPQFDELQLQTAQQALVAHCEGLRDRFALLDMPAQISRRDDVLKWRAQFDSSYAGLYFPWIKSSDPLRLQSLVRSIPPCGHLAGIFARNDAQSGPQRAPANWRLLDAKAVIHEVDERAHGDFNDAHVNIIRKLSEGNVSIQGARTLSSDMNLRFINVRRLLMMISETLDEFSQALVFEPSSENLWLRIDLSVRAYLNRIWRAGMLDGASADEAFQVRCDAQTNPPSVIEQGKVLCEISLNLPWPAEFVLVRVGFTSTGVELQEG